MAVDASASWSSTLAQTNRRRLRRKLLPPVASGGGALRRVLQCGLGAVSVALVWSALRVTRLHSPTSQSGPLRPILSVRSSNVNTNAKSKPIPDDHHREHVDADRHILDHWKGRGAQVPPQHDAQHDAVGGHAAAGNEAENGNSRADTPRFLAFHGIAQGQGAGNIVSGLLGTPATTGQTTRRDSRICGLFLNRFVPGHDAGSLGTPPSPPLTLRAFPSPNVRISPAPTLCSTVCRETQRPTCTALNSIALCV